MELSGLALVVLALAGLLTVPFVANSVTSYAINNYDEALAPIFNETPANFTSTDASKYPGISEDLLTPDVFRKSVDTPFGKFLVEISNSTLKLKLERATDTTESITSSSLSNWLLRTNSYLLNITRSPSEVTEVLQTPDGGCEKVLRDGKASERCWGIITNIDDVWEDAKKLLRENMKLMKNASDEIDIINLNSVQWEYS